MWDFAFSFQIMAIASQESYNPPLTTQQMVKEFKNRIYHVPKRAAVSMCILYRTIIQKCTERAALTTSIVHKVVVFACVHDLPY